MSSGEFVEVVLDNREEKIELKAFHGEIVNDHAALKKKINAYQELPEIRKINAKIVERNCFQIKENIWDMIELEVLRDLALSHLIIRKQTDAE